MSAKITDITKRLDEISRQYGRSDKQIAIGNLAHKSLVLLQGKNGKLDGMDRKDVLAIAERAVSLGNRHFPAGDPDEEMGDGFPKRLSKGAGGEVARKGGKKAGRDF